MTVRARPVWLAAALLLSIWAGCLALAPAAETRAYIAPDDHTDYWWSADEETYRQAHLAACRRGPAQSLVLEGRLQRR